MFDKYKERFAKIEEDHENVRKFHQHVMKYQLYYASGATAFISVAGMRILAKPTTITNLLEQAPTVVAPVFNNHNIGNVVNNTVNNGGPMRKIIRCVETDEMWPSMSKAASDAGYSLQRMSDQIHGRTEHLDGLHYVIEGLSATS